MKIYVSGPMQGQAFEGSLSFAAVGRRVAAHGHQPLLPQEIAPWGHEGECPRAHYESGGHSVACWLRSGLWEMLQCDAVVMHGAWESSVGALREHSVACWTGMKVFYNTDDIPVWGEEPIVDSELGGKVTPEMIQHATDLSGAAVDEMNGEQQREQYALEQQVAKLEDKCESLRGLLESAGRREQRWMRQLERSREQLGAVRSAVSQDPF